VPLVSAAKELAKFAIMFCSSQLLRKHHRPFANLSRYFMQDTILPVISGLPRGRVLFVGCRSYTLGYREFFRDTNVEYWTCDIDPAAKIWGEGRRHLICDIREIDVHAPPQSFNTVILNGVFGYGVDDVADMNRTAERIHRVLEHHGHLVLGWNQTRVPDPVELDAIQSLYDRDISLSLPLRKTFDDSDHVYDLFRAR
jgi:hypothetical protein